MLRLQLCRLESGLVDRQLRLLVQPLVVDLLDASVDVEVVADGPAHQRRKHPLSRSLLFQAVVNVELVVGRLMISGVGHPAVVDQQLAHGRVQHVAAVQSVPAVLHRIQNGLARARRLASRARAREIYVHGAVSDLAHAAHHLHELARRVAGGPAPRQDGVEVRPRRRVEVHPRANGGRVDDDVVLRPLGVAVRQLVRLAALGREEQYAEQRIRGGDLAVQVLGLLADVAHDGDFLILLEQLVQLSVEGRLGAVHVVDLVVGVARVIPDSDAVVLATVLAVLQALCECRRGAPRRDHAMQYLLRAAAERRIEQDELRGSLDDRAQRLPHVASALQSAGVKVEQRALGLVQQHEIVRPRAFQLADGIQLHNGHLRVSQLGRVAVEVAEARHALVGEALLERARQRHAAGDEDDPQGGEALEQPLDVHDEGAALGGVHRRSNAEARVHHEILHLLLRAGLIQTARQQVPPMNGADAGLHTQRHAEVGQLLFAFQLRPDVLLGD